MPEEEALHRIIDGILRDERQQSINPPQLHVLYEIAHRHCMYGTSRSTPVREVLALTGDKWSTLILSTLKSGEYRYSVLRKLVSALSHESEISPRMLTLSLRRMVRDGLIVRTIISAVTPHVVYRLSPLGHALLDKIESLINWAEEYSRSIDEARLLFDKLPSTGLHPFQHMDTAAAAGIDDGESWEQKINATSSHQKN